MIKESYLKGRNYYENLYDRFTVEECRRFDKRLRKIELKNKRTKKDEIELLVLRLILYNTKGERFIDKNKIISEWMKKDEKRDNFLANTKAPKIHCLHCNKKMKVTLKTLDTYIDGRKDRILFFYECNDCNKRRAFYNDKEEFRPRKTTSKLKLKDIKIPKEKIDKNFEKDRLEFCLSDKEGGDYISSKIQLEQAIKILKDSKL